ncbi:MAG: Fic family protein [Gemmatimonadales bacterium]|nr:Fic family protein [Gemmatimonadales bacterium]
MDDEFRPLIGIPADPVRTYTEAEEQRLLANLHRLSTEVHAGRARGRPITERLLCDLHRVLFEGVRSHAGTIRKPGHGQETLRFGPNRSVLRDNVPDELDELFRAVRASVESFRANPNDPAYDESAFHLAVWAHAEVIRIHPFEDGNGRSSRQLMNWLLVELGLRPLAVEVPKEEYNACLNHYFKSRARDGLAPLVDLLLRAYQAG